MKRVAQAPTALTPTDVVATALEVVEFFSPERHDYARQRQRIVATNVELRERELMELALLSAALAEVLRGHGVGDPTSSRSVASTSGGLSLGAGASANTKLPHDKTLSFDMRHHPLLFVIATLSTFTAAQQPPQIAADAEPNPRAEEIRMTACTVEEERDDDEGPSTRDLPSRQTPEWRAEYALRRAYSALFPEFLAAVSLTRDADVLMPVEGVTLSQVSDTWGAARSEGRSHEGTDIFAPEGTPIYAATSGYVQRIGFNPVGGNIVTVIGGGGTRYYYAHLSGFAETLAEGQHVTTETLLGYVGNTGNASTTPPHLHFGIYAGESYLTCDWDAENPYPLLVDRDW